MNTGATDLRPSEGAERGIPATLQHLELLLGAWRGVGTAEFPTIEDFQYSEVFRVRPDVDMRFLMFEQSTEILDAHGNPTRGGHWEAGVISALEDGSLEMVCAQGSRRAEVMRGRIVEHDPGRGVVRVRFESAAIVNDDRVRGSTREWFLAGDQLRYVMHMATTTVEALTLHLEARLKRQPPAGRPT